MAMFASLMFNFVFFGSILVFPIFIALVFWGKNVARIISMFTLALIVCVAIALILYALKAYELPVEGLSNQAEEQVANEKQAASLGVFLGLPTLVVSAIWCLATSFWFARKEKLLVSGVKA